MLDGKITCGSPITPENSVCNCERRGIIATGGDERRFHVGCGKFIPQQSGVAVDTPLFIMFTLPYTKN